MTIFCNNALLMNECLHTMIRLCSIDNPNEPGSFWLVPVHNERRKSGSGQVPLVVQVVDDLLIFLMKLHSRSSWACLSLVERIVVFRSFLGIVIPTVTHCRLRSHCP